MAQIFVSYSRIDLEFVRRLAERIQLAFPDLRIWRDDAPHGLIGGDNWWEAILKAVAESDVFIYVLSNESIQSVYCQAEFTEARRLQKRIITIQARDKTDLTDELDDIQFIDMKYGPDDPEALQRLNAALHKQLSLAKPKRPLWKTVTPRPKKESLPIRAANAPEVDTPPLQRPIAEQEALRLARSGVRWQIIGVAVSVLLGIATLILAVIPLIRDSEQRVVVQTSTFQAQDRIVTPFTPTTFPTPTAWSTQQLTATAALNTLAGLEDITLGDFNAGTQLDPNSCVSNVTDTFNAEDVIYVGLLRSEIPANIPVFVRLYVNGQAVMDTAEISSPEAYSGCVWFQLSESSGGGLEEGSYVAEIFVNRRPSDSISFSVSR